MNIDCKIHGFLESVRKTMVYRLHVVTVLKLILIIKTVQNL